MDTIGFLCEPDHPVFWPVVERLAARGFDVRFFGPDDPVTKADLDDLSALVNERLRPASFAALHYADRTGIPTWNGFVTTTALSCRLIARNALKTVGCRVPDVWLDKPDCEYVAKGLYSWAGAPTLDDDRAFYQERVKTAPITYRYYAVDDGRETHVRALAARSRLTGTAELVGQTDVDVSLAARVRELLDRFRARAIGVDFVDGEDEYYAIDVNPTPAFTGAGMDRNVADSIASLTTIGP